MNDFLSPYQEVKYNIGFIDLSQLDKDRLDVRWMKHRYTDRWFADPFILKIADGEIVLLVEEKYEPIRRGRIARLVVDQTTYQLKSTEVIFEPQTHVSFPAIIRHEGEIYLYPENSDKGKGVLKLYKYNERDKKVEEVALLCKEPLTDAIITTQFDAPYLFATKCPCPNNNVLNIYRSDAWDGPYEPYNAFVFKDNTARGAGDLFQMDGKWIRPAQDCNGGYGKGIVLQEIEYEHGKFNFIERKRFYPNSWKYRSGLHTLNVQGPIVVVDGRGFKRTSGGNLLDMVLKYIYK
jgi:hypothetical protein